jgi:hypothetical protein
VLRGIKSKKLISNRENLATDSQIK